MKINTLQIHTHNGGKIEKRMFSQNDIFQNEIILEFSCKHVFLTNTSSGCQFNNLANCLFLLDELYRI